MHFKIEVWDHDKIGSDDFEGQVIIRASELKLEHNKKESFELPLGQREGKSKEKVGGMVSGEFHFVDVAEAKRQHEEKMEEFARKLVRMENYFYLSWKLTGHNFNDKVKNSFSIFVFPFSIS